MNVTRTPECKHCGKSCKKKNAIYCSKDCYTNSGHRRAMGKANGEKRFKKFWITFANNFQKKHGHLPFAEQARLLVGIGQRKAYHYKFRHKEDK